MLPTVFTTVVLAATSSAYKLYVSSYAGNITTFDLIEHSASYQLHQLQTSQGCAPNASWLHLDAKNNNMYCLDEGMATSIGSLNSFKVNQTSGALTPVKRMNTTNAPVNSALYTSPSGEQLLAVAFYANGLGTYKLDPKTASFTPLDTINLTMSAPGPNAARQAAPHPHQVLVDPFNKYLVIPDLGADLIRVYYIDPHTLRITPRPSIPVVPGSGPRHGVFQRVPVASHSPSGGTKAARNIPEIYYYLVTELTNTLTGYRLSYKPFKGGLGLDIVSNSTMTYGPANKTFAGNAAAEIALNGNFLTVSNRNATVFDIKNPNPKNATLEKSDAMATFTADKGKVTFQQITPAGGSFARNFAVSPDGKFVAVGLQMSDRLVVYGRCPKTGKLGTEVLADFEGLGAVTSVVWGGSDVSC